MMADKTPVADADVADAMARYGAGDVTAEQAAELVRPAYDEALAERAQRSAPGYNEQFPDDASDPSAFTEVALAFNMGTITMEQYAALGAALTE